MIIAFLLLAIIGVAPVVHDAVTPDVQKCTKIKIVDSKTSVSSTNADNCKLMGTKGGSSTNK